MWDVIQKKVWIILILLIPCKEVDQQKYDIGILICGSGNGVAMTANKYPNVRAALCWDEEIASLSRKHNNANILCLPARYISQRKL